MNVLLIVLPTLILLMFCLGLELLPGDFARLMQRPRAVGVGLACQVLFLPCLAALIASLLHLSPVHAVGLVLIACCPSGSTSNVFTMLAGGDVALAVTLTGFSSLLSILTIPLAVNWALQHYLQQEAIIALSVGKVIVQYGVTVLLPMGLGMWLRLRKPEPAAVLSTHLKKISLPLLILMIAVFAWREFPTIQANIGTLGLAVAALVAAGMGIGTLVARLTRLELRERRAIVIEVGLQNAAQAIAIAVSPFLLNDASIAVPAVIYAVVMNLAMLAYLLVTGQ